MGKSLVLLKPDCIKNRKIGKVITRFEDKGLKIEAMKMLWIDEKLAKEHYAEHIEKDFFTDLLDYITDIPVIALIFSGKNAVKVVRSLVGDTDPVEASPGTIRGDFSIDLAEGNVVHASDSEKSAEKEIELFFRPEEIYSY